MDGTPLTGAAIGLIEMAKGRDLVDDAAVKVAVLEITEAVMAIVRVVETRPEPAT